MKKYQIIVVNKYNNFYDLGLYNNLDDSIEDINEYLPYGYKLKKGDLKEYSSGNSFGGYVSDILDIDCDDSEIYGYQVRGFIYDYDCSPITLKKIKEKYGKDKLFDDLELELDFLDIILSNFEVNLVDDCLEISSDGNSVQERLKFWELDTAIKFLDN